MLVPARSDAALAARTSRAVRVASVPVEAWLVGGLVLLGGLLRFATLGAQSYWFDEAQAAHELHLSLGSMFSSVYAIESNPPLYFVLGWAWVHVFGAGEVALRSLSALAGTALIAIAYLSGRELVSRRAGLLAAAFVALSPFMIWYSQEAREYMLMAAFCGASLLYFARARRDPSSVNLTWWGVFSALALLTHYFAGFLIAPEAAWLLYAVRDRRARIAVAAVAAVELALLPLLASRAVGSLVAFITATPLSLRVRYVPGAFALGTPFEGRLLGYAPIGAAALAAILIVLLIVGAERDQLRGAGVAAALAAAVLLAPLLLALVGKDYYLERALIAAWLPLAIVVAAACTTRRLAIPGAIVAAVVLAGFAYGLIKIDTDSSYQRPDWRGVASALGTAAVPRVIVAYDGGFATDPLITYLPGVAWRQPTMPVSAGEVDVVGYRWQTVGAPLPAGVRLLSTKRVNDYMVARFAVPPAWHLSPPAIAARAPELLGPGPAAAAALVQRPRAAG